MITATDLVPGASSCQRLLAGESTADTRLGGDGAMPDMTMPDTTPPDTTPPDTTPAHAGIVAGGVRRAFGDIVAVDSMDLDAAPGEVTALVGPNGAGKTTLLLVLAT